MDIKKTFDIHQSRLPESYTLTKTILSMFKINPAPNLDPFHNLSNMIPKLEASGWIS